ncbi:MAG TPA: choice-of-anchor J domain-containing protein [Candidatus Syntrophosphaera sp.]|nr:choice-of-anchor J domain-containing protein [Candidatus Syntrophosphaera sp.]
MSRKLALTIILLGILSLGRAVWLIDENFDSITTLPAGWITHDDGDGSIWRNLNNASHAHSGTRAAFCDNYLPNLNADWLITPQLSITAGDSLIFYTRAWIDTEPLKVYVSTTGTAVNNFTAQILNLQNLGTAYYRASCSLSAYAGQNIHLGWLWNCETYGILVDDIKVGQPPLVPPVLDLPESFTFVQGESITVDFTPYITCTDINTASLSVSGNVNVNVQISGRTVMFSSPAFNGTENLTFTLTDGNSGLTDTDTVQIIVLPPPVADLGIVQIISPREIEYVDHVFYPAIQIQNTGSVPYNGAVTVSCLLQTGMGIEVYYDSASFAVNMAPQQTQSITMPTGFIPQFEGGYSAGFYLAPADDNPTNNSLTAPFTVVTRVTQGGPDGFGYRWVDSDDESGPDYVWEDISQSGASTIMYNVPSWGGDDNFSEAIPLGFNFQFYGQSYDHMYVDINGEILLAENNWQEEYPSPGWDGDGNMFNYMYPLPGYASMPGLIAVYWDDLFAEQGVGDIYFQTLGQAPNRRTIVQWNNLRFLAGTGGTSSLKFQVVIREDGELLMQYNTTQNGQSGSTVPHQNGRSATVGIQNEATNLGLCYLREIVQNNEYQGVEPPGNLLHDGLAIRFYQGQDTQPPVLTHTALGNTFDSSPLIKVNAIDLSAISQINLLYNTGGTWNTLDPASQQGSDYFFQLPELPLGAELHYYFMASDIQLNSGTLPAGAPADFYTFKILPTPETRMLLAYSGSQDYQHQELPVYENLLNSLDMDYDIYNWEEYPSYLFPLQYDAILCYASVGSYSVRADTLSLALMQYLDSGTTEDTKNVFFSSDGWAFSQGGFPNSSPMKKLFEGYFRTSYVATGFGGGTNGLAGPDVFIYSGGSILCRENSPIGDSGFEYPVYANSPDCIFRYDSCPDWYADQVQYPEIGAVNAFTFEDGPVDGHAYLQNGVCATALTLPIYKAFYFSFDYSQLTQLSDRLSLMQDLLDWFGITGTSGSDASAPGLKTRISGVWPNPLNPRGTVSFSLSKAASARLEVYNLRGQKVAILADAELPAGVHTREWDGHDASGRPVSSGVYLLRLQTPQASDSRKLILLK